MKRKRQTRETVEDEGKGSSSGRADTQISIPRDDNDEEPDSFETQSRAKEEDTQSRSIMSDVEDTPATFDRTPQRKKTSRMDNGTPSKQHSLLDKIQNAKLLTTPSKTKGTLDPNDTPKLERHIDRSARRKSTRLLIERTVLGNISDNEDEDEDLAQHIYSSGGEDELGMAEEENDSEVPGHITAPVGPAKRGRKPGSKNRKRSPTPPQDLPPHELYFSQNRSGRSKTSNNTLANLVLLDHEEYFKLLREYENPHAEDLEYLHGLHVSCFRQWWFELTQDFNICIYGWGSKRPLLLEFADYVYNTHSDHTKSKIVIVNGYVSTLSIRDVLNMIAAAISDPPPKLGSQPTEMLERLLALLTEAAISITLLINSIDATPLRRPTTQSILARLSAHPQIHLLASADHPSFPLLWDSSLRSTFNFLFHEAATFQPYEAEVDVVDEVHELLGRSGRRVGGKEGVSFVLKSLPENAKNLFRVLIGEQLAALDENAGGGYGHDDDDDEDDGPAGAETGGEAGVEYRILYQKAVEEFICSNEMNFRTLLKEFHDHQMIQSRKDVMGTEILSLPFRKEELETILEDIMA